MIPAGERNQFITIQSATEAADALGQPVKTWADYTTAWVRVRHPNRGREFQGAGAGQSEAEVIFGGCYRPDITSAMRVIWRNVVYSIIAEPIDVHGGRHTTELHCASGPRSET